MMQATPRQLVLGYDLILYTPCITDCEAIRQRKQNLTDNNNQVENQNCKAHTYRIHDKVLLHNKKRTYMSIHTWNPIQ